MTILGLNAYHGDSAACLIKDGKFVAAAEEERFRRIKHWAGLPTRAIDYCLREGDIALGDVDHIAINRKPGTNNRRIDILHADIQGAEVQMLHGAATDPGARTSDRQEIRFMEPQDHRRL
jgi:predicted NodU family carbamoyl transferase